MVCHEWEENQHYCCWMCECWWHLHSTYGDLECEDDAFWYGSWWSPWYLTRIFWQWMNRSRIVWHLVPQSSLAVYTFSPSTASLNGRTQQPLLPWNHPSSCKQKVILFTIPPNTTYLSQPLDKVFLVHWKRFTHARSTYVRSTYAKSTYARSPYARSTYARNQLARGQLSQNQLSRNQLAQGQLARDQLARDQLFTRSTPRSQLLLDQLLRDQLRKINSVCTVLFMINAISSLMRLHPLCGHGTF